MLKFLFNVLTQFSVSCPDGFQWDIKAKKCYTIEIYGPIKGSDTVKACQNLLPESYPAEPRDSVQMNHIKEVGGEIRPDIWVKVVILMTEIR